MKYQKGEIVRVILTAEVGMIIDFCMVPGQTQCAGFEPGYEVRLRDYSVRQFFDFELEKRETKSEVD